MINSLLFSGKRRKVFSDAYKKGAGMSIGDGLFIRFAEQNSGIKALMATLLIFVTGALLFTILKDNRDSWSSVIYRILMFGALWSLIISMVFLPSVLANYYSHRIDSALKVTDCVMKTGDSMSKCGKHVRKE